MEDPKVNYQTNTTFGSRIQDMKDDKWKVAERVVEDFIGTGSSAFIGDGSSTFSIGLKLFARGRQVKLWTNHLAIAHEFALRASTSTLVGTEVTLAGGDVNRDLMMTCGPDAEAFAEASSKKAQNVVLSARCLFAEHGPAGLETQSLNIKQLATNGATAGGRRLIFITDYKKLSQEYSDDIPLVFPSEADWDAFMHRKNVYIVTTRHPDAPTMVQRSVSNPRSEVEWYCYHSRKLNAVMNTMIGGQRKDHFIEI